MKVTVRPARAAAKAAVYPSNHIAVGNPIELIDIACRAHQTASCAGVGRIEESNALCPIISTLRPAARTRG